VKRGTRPAATTMAADGTTVTEQRKTHTRSVKAMKQYFEQCKKTNKVKETKKKL